MLPSLVMIENPAPLTDDDVEAPAPAEPVNGKVHHTKSKRGKFSKEQIFKYFKLVDEKKFTIKELAAREGFGQSTYSNWRKVYGDEYASSLGGVTADIPTPPHKRKKTKAGTVTLTDQLREFKRQKAVIWADAERKCEAVTTQAQAAVSEIDKKIIALTDTIE